MERTVRTFELTVEESEVVILHRRRMLLIEWCTGCGRRARMTGPEDAAAILRIAVRTIYQKVESGTLHFIEEADGRLLVCMESLEESL